MVGGEWNVISILGGHDGLDLDSGIVLSQVKKLQV